MVISVTKTQINCVALVIQFRVLGSRLFNKLGDAPHFFVVLCDKAFKTLGGVVNKTRLRLSRHEIHHFGEYRVSRRKQLGVIACAAFVPVAKRLPFVSVLSGTKNIALSREDEVRADRQCEIGEPGFE